MSAPWFAGHEDLLPPDPDLEPLHRRTYEVRAWRIDETSMLIRGAVMDQKPGAMFAAGIEAAGGQPDDRPLTMHHMVVDLVVRFPELVIDDASVVFEAHPQPGCPSIAPHYRDLVGLSIARGFTHEVRQRFGGPRGCTHTTALLQAMGPVAVQCIFSMRRVAPGARAGDSSGQASFMRDTCHVWSSEGELWERMTEGHPPPPPLPIQRRFEELGAQPPAYGPG